MCFAPSGLEFLGDARPNPGRRPPMQTVTDGCRKDTAFCGSGFSRDPILKFPMMKKLSY